MVFQLNNKKYSIELNLKYVFLVSCIFLLSFNFEAQDYRLFKKAYFINELKGGFYKNQKVELALQTDLFLKEQFNNSN